MLLKKGNVVQIKVGHFVYMNIPKHFIIDNCIGDFSLTQKKICVGSTYKGFDTNYLLGKYIVTKTSTDGGGEGHGPHDTYPDGHHVFCTKVIDSNEVEININFYQTGSFTAMIKPGEIEIIGQAKAKWEYSLDDEKSLSSIE